MKVKPFAVVVSLLLTSQYALAQQSSERYTQYVNPFIGTGAVDSNSLSESNFPGSTLPFVFVQLSPDKEDGPDDPEYGVYAIGSPILVKAELKMPNGNTFTVIAHHPSNQNCYIQSVKLNEWKGL
ncbi:MAG: glycoside hydrolase family 92 protein [Chitinophagaceae bacterium]